MGGKSHALLTLTSYNKQESHVSSVSLTVLRMYKYVYLTKIYQFRKSRNVESGITVPLLWHSVKRQYDLYVPRIFMLLISGEE